MNPDTVRLVLAGLFAAGLLIGLLSLFRTTRIVVRIAWKLVKVIARFFTGQPLDGKFRTNATFLSAGTDDTRERSWWSRREPTRWAYLPGYHRLIIRLICVVFAVAFVVWPAQLKVVSVVITGVVLGVAVWRGVVAFTLYRHRRDVVYPLHAALCGVVGHPSSIQPEDWLEIPTDYATDFEARMVLRLPEDFAVADGKLVKIIAVTACEKLGLDFEEMQHVLHPQTSAPWLELKHAPKLPRLVLASDMFDVLAEAPESAPIVGVTAGDRPVAVDLDDEAPHTLLSMSTGGGKSNYAYGQAVQMLHNGAHVLILDYKRTSLKWLRDHPNVTYLRDIKDIHNALLWLATEGEMRNRMTDDLEDDEVLPFTRLFVVCEEQNVCIRKLSRYWKKIRDKKDPERSPAVDALEDVASMGRSVLENLLAIAQFGSATATGGSAIRENYGNRVLARYTVRAWQMLAPEIQPMPKKSDIPGRVQVVRAGRATETQVLLWDKESVREWAWSGDFSQPPKLALGFLPVGEGVEKLSTMLAAGELPEPVEQLPVLEAEVVSEGPAAVPAEELVTLRRAVELGIEPVRDDGVDTFEKALMRIRKARQEDPEFPEPKVKSRAGDRWSRAALEQWSRNRVRAGVRIEEMSD